MEYLKGLSAIISKKNTDAGEKKLAEINKAVVGGLIGDIFHGEKAPLKDLPEWTTYNVVQGGFASSAMFLLKKSESNWDYINNPEKLDDLCNYLKHVKPTLKGPEPLMLITYGLLNKQGHIDEARKLLEIIKPYLDKLRFYPTNDELSEIPLEPEICSAITNISFVSSEYFRKKISVLNESKQMFLKKQQKELIKIELHNIFKETLFNEKALEQLSHNWFKKAEIVLTKFENYIKEYGILQKRGRFYNYGIILRYFINIYNRGNKTKSEEDLKKTFDLILSKSIILNYVLSSNIKVYDNKTKKTVYNILEGKRIIIKDICGRIKTYLDVKLDETVSTMNLEDKITLLENINNTLKNIKTEYLSKNDLEMIKENFELKNNNNFENSIIDNLKKATLHTFDELCEYNMCPSAEEFAILIRPMESYLKSIGVNVSNISPEEHLKYLIYKAYKNRRSLCLFNINELQSNLKLTEVPHYNIINKICKKEENEDELYIARYMLTMYTRLFPDVPIPNTVIASMYNLLKTNKEFKLGFTKKLAPDIFSNAFSNTFEIAYSIASNKMRNTLYEYYFQLTKYYNKDIKNNLYNSSIDYKKVLYGDNPVQLRTQHYGYYYYGGNSVNDNGKTLTASEIITTHNLVQFSEFIMPDLLEPKNIINKITDTLIKLIKPENENSTIVPLTLSKIGDIWKSLIYYISTYFTCQDMSEYIIHTIIKVIWYNICNNKDNYLNINKVETHSELGMKFINKIINKNLKDISSNNQYVTYEDIINNTPNINVPYHDHLYNSARYMSYIEDTQHNRRICLFLSSLMENCISYYNIKIYNDIFVKQDIILGWMNTGTIHILNNDLNLKSLFNTFKDQCKILKTKVHTQAKKKNSRK